MTIDHGTGWPSLKHLPLPVKTLFTCLIAVMCIALAGAMGQVLIHDIIPTFFSEEEHAMRMMDGEASEVMKDDIPEAELSGSRDIFGDLDIPEIQSERIPYYKTEQFVWLLKWTHIHLFGMSMIFIFVGMITVFLDLPPACRAWLVALPFAGVLLDIAAMWLKTYVSPAFFWLHVPGGGLFGAIFIYVAVRASLEMWGTDGGERRRP